MAVAFHPDAEYVALDSGGEVYIVAEELAQRDDREVQSCATRRRSRRFPARKLERVTFQHPFLDRKILGVLGDYVTMDTGTGAVHTAPAHGADDFITGVKYGLDAHQQRGRSGHPAQRLAGVRRAAGLQGQPADRRSAEGARRAAGIRKRLEHSYPHCWRCHNPVIFRATEQWFISMETPMPRRRRTLRTRRWTRSRR